MVPQAPGSGFEVRPLDPDGDLGPVDDLASAAYASPSRRAELTDSLAIAPHGWFVVAEGRQLVALGGVTLYGPFGWIGLVGVHPGRRRRGLGGLVTRRCLEVIEAAGATAVLDASELGTPLYTAMGFTDLGPTTELVAPPVPAPAAQAGTRPPSPVAVRPVDPGCMPPPDLLAYDRAAFGADRSRVLDRFAARAGDGRVLVARRDGDRAAAGRGAGPVVGYAIAGRRRLAPWVADDEAALVALAGAALALPFEDPPVVQVPPESRHRATLERLGFTRRRVLRHMRLPAGGTGVDVPGDPARLVGRASYGLG